MSQGEERYRDTFESRNVMVLIHDLQGNIKDVNKQVLDTLGYTWPEILSLNVKDINPETSYDSAEELDDTSRDNFIIRDEVTFKKKNRDSVPVSVISNRLEIRNGDLIICIAHDTSEQKRKEERMLIRDRAFLSVSNGVVVTDPNQPDNPIIHCNPAFERITGYLRDEIIGINLRFLHKDDDDQEGIRKLSKAVEEEREGTALFRNYKKDGTLFWNELTISPVKDESGQLTHLVGVINDVTKRKASEELQKQYHAELEQRVRDNSAEIIEVNKSLWREIAERRRAEGIVRTRAQQQSIVAELGHQALKGLDTTTLMEKTVSKVAGILGVEFSKILELLPDGKDLHIRARVGWKDKYVGRATVSAGTDSQAGYTLLAKEPVIVEDLRREDRFRGPPLLTDHGVVSGISIVIDGGERPFGVLGAHTTKRRTFSKDDINFLQAVANLLAQAIERKKAEYRLQNAFGEIKQLKDQLVKENIYLQEEIELEYGHGEIIGKTKAIKDVLRQVEQVADSDSTVLLTGETGTGKELLAHAIHKLSKRQDRLMVKMNCAALPSSLIESELFGHEKGSFTGAVSRRIGRFEIADGSTILLDEIGQLPVELQPKLLRVLQEGEFERVGSSKTLKVDLRVIAASNTDLEKAIEEGRFREDLYYRLNIFPISLPPLRERTEDIPLLVKAFVKESGERIGKRIEKIPKGIIGLLKGYSWPGNVRELKSVIERAVVLERGNSLHVELPELKRSKYGARLTKPDSKIRDIEKEHILNVLEMSSWRIRGEGGAAEILGLKPTTLASKMRKLGIVRHQ